MVHKNYDKSNKYSRRNTKTKTLKLSNSNKMAFCFDIFSYHLSDGVFVKSLKPETYIIKSLKAEAKIQNPIHEDSLLFFEIFQANDKNLALDGKEYMRGLRASYAGSLAVLCNLLNATIGAKNSTSDLRFSLRVEGHLEN